MKACESVVCQNVGTIGLDSTSNRIVIVSPDGRLFMADSPQTSLDLSQAARSIPSRQGHAESIEAGDKILWQAVGSEGGKIVVGGHNETKKRLEYLLVEVVMMTPLDRLTVTEQTTDGKETGVRHIKLTSYSGRLVAVCCRFYRFVDILQVTDNGLEPGIRNRVIDITGDRIYKDINSISQHASRKNIFLLGGREWLKKLELHAD